MNVNPPLMSIPESPHAENIPEVNVSLLLIRMLMQIPLGMFYLSGIIVENHRSDTPLMNQKARADTQLQIMYPCSTYPSLSRRLYTRCPHITLQGVLTKLSRIPIGFAQLRKSWKPWRRTIPGSWFLYPQGNDKWAVSGYFQ